MLSNLHTHCVFCDGKNTPEEIVLTAIEKDFCSIGFSSHAFTDFDPSYCMQDTAGYINEINRLKEKYKKDIEIYLGAEEDMFSLTNRSNFRYIIGSCHYFNTKGQFYSIDLSKEMLLEVLKLYDNDILKLSDDYYSNFCDYILKRKPDIIGHFDIITKFDELGEAMFFNNKKYLELSKNYLLTALKSDCIFEVNTGAISRNYRTTPYPYENLLFELKKNDGKITITSDSHSIDTLDFKFDDVKAYLKEIGFTYTYMLYKDEFTKVTL